MTNELWDGILVLLAIAIAALSVFYGWWRTK